MPTKYISLPRSSTASAAESLQSAGRRMSAGATLPRSWRETRLVTKVKEETDGEKVKERQALTAQQSPAQLAQMTSVADLPVPAPLQNLFSPKKKKPRQQVGREKTIGQCGFLQ